MRAKVAVACLVLWGGARSTGAQETAAFDRNSRLPVKRVVLYKNGVGYFEHVGTVRGSESVTVPFTSSQLNDVLKSLTVLDLSGGRIAGVAYGTAKPVDRELTDLQMPEANNASLGGLLQGMRGAHIEVKGSGLALTGHILGVDRRSRSAGNAAIETEYLSLLSDGGELRSVELSPAISLKLLEPGLAAKLNRFLDVTAKGRAAEQRQMLISTEGSGERSLFVSYISEVPVWKSTYRIVLKPGASGDKTALLQAWAIVDNTLSEDWTNVQLSLVAGAPQSFIQNLSQPFYAPRPIIPLPQMAMIAPQTQEATLTIGGGRLVGTIKDPAGSTVSGARVTAYDGSGAVVGQATSNANGSYALEGMPSSPLRVSVEAPGFIRSDMAEVLVPMNGETRKDTLLSLGNTAQSVTVNASAPHAASLGTGRTLGNSTYTKSVSGYGAGSGGGGGGGVYRMGAEQPVAAAPQELGDLFEYKLKEPITIARNRSALVPISQASIKAERVSLWNGQSRLVKPLRALWITNSSALTLDGGSVSVLDDDAFAGEGVLDPIRPGEKRLLTYATDLALTVNAKEATDAQRVTRARIEKGVMTQESEVREKKTYTFRNEDDQPRTIIIEHPVRAGYLLRGDLKPVETTPNWQRFRVQVEPRHTASLTVEEARPLQSNIMLATLEPAQVGIFVSQRSIDSSIRTALEGVMGQKKVVEQLESAKEACEAESSKIFDDQQRLRENIKALSGASGEKSLLQRYLQQLNDQETRLADLDKRQERLEVDHGKAEEKLNAMIASLSFDVQL